MEAASTSASGSFELNVPDAPREMWLIKVPSKEMADAIESALDNEEIGLLKRHKNTPTAGPPSKRHKYDVEVCSTFAKRAEAKQNKNKSGPGQSQTLPTAYQLKFQDKAPAISIFTETNDGSKKGPVTAIGFEGVVGAEANLVLDSNNFAAVSARFNDKVTKSNTHAKAVGVEEQKIGHSFNPRGKAAMLDSKPMKKNEKRTRENVTDNEIQNRILNMFKHWEYIRLKDMTKELNLPEGAIRRELIKLADPEKGIEHRNTWRLKTQYQAN